MRPEFGAEATVTDNSVHLSYIVGDFNFSNIIWKYDHGDDVNAVCSGLSDSELKFVNTVRENLFSQHIDLSLIHISEPTRPY